MDRETGVGGKDKQAEREREIDRKNREWRDEQKDRGKWRKAEKEKEAREKDRDAEDMNMDVKTAMRAFKK